MLSTRQWLWAGSLLLYFAMTALPFPAQGVYARLEGLVQDSSQAVIPGVSVVATNEGTNIIYASVTNEAGRYVFVTLPPGTYSLKAELPGFKKALRSGILLQVGDARTVNISMEVGEVSQDVTVFLETPLMDLTTTKVGSVVQQRQIVELPLNGRNAMMLFYLAAGTNPIERLGGQQQTGTVDGLAPNANNVKVEGIFASNPGVDYSPADPAFPVPQEAVGEYRVTTSGGMADAGRGSGAQVSVFLKSGTNDFHGSLFEFNRNTAFNANDFFNNRSGGRRPDIKRNEFGFSLGGPIIKNRTFFFGTLEWQRQNQSSIQNRLVYTPALREGIFRYNLQGSNSSSNVDSNGNPRVPFSTINLLTVDPTRLGMDTVFLPELLRVLPLPNNYDIGDGFNLAGYRYTSPGPLNGNQWLFKIDHELSSRNHLSFAYSRYKINQRAATLINGISPEGFIELKRGGSLRLISSLSPRLTNEFSVGGNLRLAARPITNPAQETPRGNIQLIGLGTGNIYTLRASQNNPGVNLGFANNMSWVTGNHTLSFGGEMWYQTFNSLIGFGTGSDGQNTLPFPVIRTDNASNAANVPAMSGLSSTDRAMAQQLTNDLTVTIGSISQTFFLNNKNAYVPYEGSYRPLRNLETSLFLQDIWKVRSNFSLDLGLRYEMLPPAWMANDGVFGYPIGGVEGALGIQGPTGQPTRWGHVPHASRGIMKTDKNNFAPKLGFSWDPFAKGSTTISGSYGISYDRSMLLVYSGLSSTNYGAATDVTLTPFTRLSEPKLYTSILPIPTPPPFQALGFTRDSRAYVADPNIRTPYVQSWSFRIARQIGTNWKIEATYVGNHAVGQWRAQNLNQIELRNNGFLDAFNIAQRNLAQSGNPTTGQSLGNLQSLFSLIPAAQYSLITQGQAAALANFLDTTTLMTGIRGGLIDRAVLPKTFFRFNPQVQNLNIVGNRGHSTWDALKLKVNRRLHQGLYMEGNYTLSKGFTDYITGQTLFQDYRDNANAKLDKALSPFDQTHRLTVNWIYELPFGRGLRFLSNPSRVVQGFLGGWQINGIYNWVTGYPLQITTGRFNLSATIASTPNFTGTPVTLSKVTKGNQITTLTAAQIAQFSNPGPGETGNLPKYSLRGPGFSNADVSLFKKFSLSALREDTQAQFRVEFFNVFNHANFNAPAASINSGSFGVISSARPARVGQLALKILF